jgi:phosphohistidine phosphatase
MLFLADIFDRVSQQIDTHQYKLDCVGGGRIEHDVNKKVIKVYGYSQVGIICHLIYNHT